MGHYKEELASQTGRVRDCPCSTAGLVAGSMLAFAGGKDGRYMVKVRGCVLRFWLRKTEP